jgi:hypothetical protein
MLRSNPRPSPFSGGTVSEQRMTNITSSPYSQDDLDNTQRGRNIQVRVERSVVLDPELEDSASIDKYIKSPAKSFWDSDCGA